MVPPRIFANPFNSQIAPHGRLCIFVGCVLLLRHSPAVRWAFESEVYGMNLVAANQVRKIDTVTGLDELDGLEKAAKLRGLLPEEIRAIHARRKQLTPKKRRKR